MLVTPVHFLVIHFLVVHDVADLDGNGYWDQTEVKALFVKELDKMYQSGAPEDDMRERAEELERMREHVFREADKNQDRKYILVLAVGTSRKEDTEQQECDDDTIWKTPLSKSWIYYWVMFISAIPHYQL